MVHVPVRYVTNYQRPMDHHVPHDHQAALSPAPGTEATLSTTFSPTPTTSDISPSEIRKGNNMKYQSFIYPQKKSNDI